jgi:2-hydroxy-3-oxopropionate reductase
MKVAFIGLGIMGRPMAVNLSRAGFDVIAHTRSEAGRSHARGLGVEVVDSLGELPPDCDVIITMLPDGPDVEAVLLSGPLAIGPDTLVIDMSTIAPSSARRVAQALAERGGRFLDAPVSGGETGAIDGVLSIMVGGADSDFASALPVFEAMGKTIVHVGDVGSGQVVKAANQLIVAGNLQLIAEALVFVDGHGVDRGRALDVLSGGLAGSTAMTRKRQNFLDRSYDPGFRIALHDKDLGIVARSAREARLALPVTALVSQLVEALVAQGHGALDHSALYMLAEQLSPISSTAELQEAAR